jgi:chemotaxis protein MotB
MVKQAMIFASILSALLVAGLVGYLMYRQQAQFQAVNTELAAVKQAAEQGSARTAQLQQELTNSHRRIEALLAEKEKVTENQARMEQQMRTALQSKDVTISELRGSLTVNILDRVLFDSGEAELKPEGEKVLSQVAGVLTQHTNRQIYVIGHTDNVPIRSTVFSRYASNWELSTARATSAVRYLAEQAGVDASRLAAIGSGEYHPVADNGTAEGRAKNRRISIVIVPELFNPLQEVVSTNQPAATNVAAAAISTNTVLTNAAIRLIPTATNSVLTNRAAVPPTQ